MDQDNAFSATGSWLPTEAFSHAVDTRALYTALEEEGSLQCLPPAALFTADVGGPEAQQAVEALSRRLQRLSDESPFFLVYVRGKLDLTTAGSSGTAWTEGNRQEVEGCKAIGLACFIPARLIPGEITIEVQGHIAPESSFVTSLVVAERDGASSCLHIPWYLHLMTPCPDVLTSLKLSLSIFRQTLNVMQVIPGDLLAIHELWTCPGKHWMRSSWKICMARLVLYLLFTMGKGPLIRVIGSQQFYVLSL